MLPAAILNIYKITQVYTLHKPKIHLTGFRKGAQQIYENFFPHRTNCKHVSMEIFSFAAMTHRTMITAPQMPPQMNIWTSQT